MLIGLGLEGLKNKDINSNLPTPVRHLPRPYWSMHFGNVSETKGRGKKTCSDHVTRNALAARNNEA